MGAIQSCTYGTSRVGIYGGLAVAAVAAVVALIVLGSILGGWISVKYGITTGMAPGVAKWFAIAKWSGVAVASGLGLAGLSWLADTAVKNVKCCQGSQQYYTKFKKQD